MKKSKYYIIPKSPLWYAVKVGKIALVGGAFVAMSINL